MCGWLTVKLVILPVGLFYLARAVYPEYALSALLLGGISSGVVTPFFSTLLRANTALVIMMVTVSSMLVPFTLPVLVRTLAGETLVISLLVVVFSSEFFGPLDPLVALLYSVPFFCSIVFLRVYAARLEKGLNWREVAESTPHKTKTSRQHR